MITVAILINGQPIVARSAVNTGETNHGQTRYRVDDGATVWHCREDGAAELAKKLLDTIKVDPNERKGEGYAPCIGNTTEAIQQLRDAGLDAWDEVEDPGALLRELRGDERIPAEVFPPGEYIRDELDEASWDASILASRMGVSEAYVKQLLAAEVKLTVSMAERLAKALPGLSAASWLNIQKSYERAEAAKNAPDFPRRGSGSP